MATTPTYSVQAMLPDALKVRPVDSYPTRPMGGKYNQQAFDLAGIPPNYVAPPPPPRPPVTPGTPGGFNLQDWLAQHGGSLNLGGLGNINLQALLSQYGGLLGNRSQVPAPPPAPTTQTAQFDPRMLANLIAAKRFM